MTNSYKKINQNVNQKIYREICFQGSVIKFHDNCGVKSLASVLKNNKIVLDDSPSKIVPTVKYVSCQENNRNDNVLLNSTGGFEFTKH